MGIDWEKINGPTLIVREQVARRNLKRMWEKAQAAGVELRPHFKTHQSAGIGSWARDAGVEKITVSSLDMAEYFAAHGWQDITIAIPANVRECRRIDALARRVNLNVVVDSLHAAEILLEKVESHLRIWIEIDVGDGRSGISWSDVTRYAAVARLLDHHDLHAFAGLIAHAGHTYAAKGKEEVLEIHDFYLKALKVVRDTLGKLGVPVEQISVGDTPTCSLADTFPGATEIRPGNFIFYDLMQEGIGSCVEEDIALALAAPVIGKYPDRNELILHAGAVYLGKDRLLDDNGDAVYGRLALPTSDGWSNHLPGCSLVSLSQEHAIARVSAAIMSDVSIGDLMLVLPVHSCLAADLVGSYTTAQSQASGKQILSMRSHLPLPPG
jgi:D-serine deaminase-like pyridoxal phosphate-dependent protein